VIVEHEDAEGATVEVEDDDELREVRGGTVRVRGWPGL